MPIAQTKTYFFERLASLVPIGAAGVCVVAGAFIISSIPFIPGQPGLALLAYASMIAGALAGAALLWRRDDRPALGVLAAVALLARSPLLQKEPFFSEDAYRYLWEGEQLLRGSDPYVATPDDPALAQMRAGWLYRHIYWHGVPSLYPPLDLAMFALAYEFDRTDLRGIKTLVAAGDLLALALLIALLRRRGLPAGRAALYAWSPLVLVEFSWSGHEEAWCLAALAAALLLRDRHKPAAASLALAAAVLVKLYPLVLLPVFFPRGPRALFAVCLGAVGLAYLPFAMWHPNVLGFLNDFATQYHFNDTLHGLLRTPGSTALFALCVAAAAYARLRGAELVRTAFLLLLAYFVLSPNVYPWYLSVLLVLLPLMPDAFAGELKPLTLGTLAWTFLSIVGYASEATPAARVVEYAPLFAGLGAVAIGMARRQFALTGPAKAQEAA